MRCVVATYHVDDLYYICLGLSQASCAPAATLARAQSRAPPGPRAPATAPVVRCVHLLLAPMSCKVVSGGDTQVDWRMATRYE
jgi:hypothetical protein